MRAGLKEAKPPFVTDQCSELLVAERIKSNDHGGGKEQIYPVKDTCRKGKKDGVAKRREGFFIQLLGHVGNVIQDGHICHRMLRYH